MKTIKFAVLATALVALTISVNAQRRGERPSPEKIAEMATDKMDQRLDLSDRQESKILAINLKYAKANAEQQAARKTNTKRPEAGEKLSRENRKAMMEYRKEMMKSQKDSRQAQKMEIMSHLDDKQKLKYAEMVASSNQPRGKRGNQTPHKGKMRGPVRNNATQCKMKK